VNDVLFALVDIEADEEEREEVRARWIGFLEGLGELDAEDAEKRVHSFCLILDGLLRSDPSPDVDDAQNDGEGV
jgi:hypothetical protein